MPPVSKKQRVESPSPTITPTKKSKAKVTPKKSKGKGKAVDVEPEASTSKKQFITASSGDAYLLSHSGPSKTSDSLLSEDIPIAFTIPSYNQSLREFDSLNLPELVQMREDQAEREDIIRCGFDRWLFELEEGFSVFLWGIGCKKTILEDFVDECRTKGEVVVVEENGEILDLLTALEELLEVKKGEKGKGKMIEKVKVTTGGIDGRVKRFCENLEKEGKNEVFLVVHGLDSSPLKKYLSLLVILASQPKIHLISSLDHLRFGLLFPTTIGFKLLFHEASTLLPFSRNETLSKLLPTSIFPEINDTAGNSTSSLAQSTRYVLASVPARSKKLFTLLSTLQLELSSSLSSAQLRSLQLTPTIHSAAPTVAVQLSKLRSLCRQEFIASSDDQVDTLLGEFMDHGVVRKSVIGPIGTEEVGDWVWIPLGVEDLISVKSLNE